jgi:hypothetical protein
MISVAKDESALHAEFFSHPDAPTKDLLDLHLSDLAEPLYSTARPRILHLARIDVLADVCGLLDGYQGEVLARVREDAQSRLVFRAQAYLAQEIAGFKPREEEILLFARSLLLPMPISVVGRVSVGPVLENVTERTDVDVEVDDGVKVERGEMVYGGGEWYPTLARTLFILGKLYKAVPAGVFTDLSQEAVEICRASLVDASVVIGSKQTGLDGQLFLIKNLLMLREEISRFDGNFVRKEDEIDLSSLQGIRV